MEAEEQEQEEHELRYTDSLAFPYHGDRCSGLPKGSVGIGMDMDREVVGRKFKEGKAYLVQGASIRHLRISS